MNTITSAFIVHYYSSRLFLLIALFFSFNALAQQQDTSESYIIIEEICYIGNSKTRERVVERELTFHVGDTIAIEAIGTMIASNEKLLTNNFLFKSARINISQWDIRTNQVRLDVWVEERWYYYPSPIFELSDRNFNVWWVQQHRDLKRTNIGLDIKVNNLTGNYDQLKLKGQLGFTPKFQIDYQFPYINRKQTIGLLLNALWTTNEEVVYAIEGNKEVFGREGGRKLLNRFRLVLGLDYRPRLFTHHFLKIGYLSNTIDSVVTLWNQDYFLNGATAQRFLTASYEYTFNNARTVFYPMTGDQIKFGVTDEGLGLAKNYHNLQLKFKWSNYHTLTDRFSYYTELYGQLSLIRTKMPFYNYRGLGYDQDYVRGYEYYVFNGLDYGMLRTNFRMKLMDKDWNWKRWMPVKQLKIMNYQIYFGIINDFAYINDPYYGKDNHLNNKLLWGTGVGIDVVLYKTAVCRFNIVRNHLSNIGLYLHLN